MYSCHSWQDFQEHVQTPLPEKPEPFSQIFIRFLKTSQNFAHFQKKISLIAEIFRSLLSPRNVLTSIPESSCFRTPFESQRLHLSQTLLKFPQQYFYPNFPLTTDKLSQKTSLSVRSEISGLFGNTLTADHIYFHHNWENFPQHVETPWSQKQGPFSEIFIPFLESVQNFGYFEKNDHLRRLNIWRLHSPGNVVSWMPENSRIRTPFKSQHLRVSQTLPKSARLSFYLNLPLTTEKRS